MILCTLCTLTNTIVKFQFFSLENLLCCAALNLITFRSFLTHKKVCIFQVTYNSKIPQNSKYHNLVCFGRIRMERLLFYLKEHEKYIYLNINFNIPKSVIKKTYYHVYFINIIVILRFFFNAFVIYMIFVSSTGNKKIKRISKFMGQYK